MPTKPTPTFATIDPADLATVSGGRRAASSGSSRADFDQRMMDTLNSIENSIRDLGRNQNQGSDAMSQLMPLLAMSLLNQPAAAPQVICGKGKKGW